MPSFLVLVTVPNVVPTSDGSFRKRGCVVRELRGRVNYTHVSQRQLRRYAERLILAADLKVACRQADIYVAGKLVTSLRPARDVAEVLDNATSPIGQVAFPTCGVCGQADCDCDYSASLRDSLDSFSRVPSLAGDDPIRDMLRDFKPVATIFGQAAIGDNCVEAISQLGK